MQAISFNESNACLGPPEGMTPEEVSALSIWRGEMLFHGMDRPVMTVVSCYKLSKEELEEVNKTGKVWLAIMGPTMLPAALMGISPFKEIDWPPKDDELESKTN